MINIYKHEFSELRKYRTKISLEKSKKKIIKTTMTLLEVSKAFFTTVIYYNLINKVE